MTWKWKTIKVTTGNGESFQFRMLADIVDGYIQIIDPESVPDYDWQKIDDNGGIKRMEVIE